MVLQALKGQETVAQLTARYEIYSNQIQSWKKPPIKSAGPTSNSGPIRPWATGHRPKLSTGSREFWNRDPMQGGVHREKDQNYWQERRGSRLTQHQFCLNPNPPK